MRALGTLVISLALFACGTDSPSLVCGPETTLVGSQCVALTALCGDGTVLDNGYCIPEAALLVCGEGTENIDGVCTPIGRDLICGDGTEELLGECVASGQLDCGDGTVELDGACVPAYEEVVCGVGTELVSGVCESTIRCGPGTELVDFACVAGFPETACGAGTISDGDECVAAYAEISCGPGTVETGGVCEATGEGLACGDLTEEVEGACFPVESLHECGPDTVVGGDGTCRRVTRSLVQAPLAAGTEATVSQCNYGYFSHDSASAYAVDIAVPVGTELLAVRSGTVVAFREDSESGCGDESCADEANWLILAHDDGTHAAYFHLDTLGVLVELGERVCAGQLVALSGNTGFSTGPHLHLEVRDFVALAAQFGFEELVPTTGGAPVNGVTLVGSVVEPDVCGDSPAFFEPRTYEHRGVLLDETTPRAVEIDRPYPMSGRVTDGSAFLQVGRWQPRIGGYAYECHAVDEDGAFSIELTWSAALYDPSSAYMHLSAAAEDCFSNGGWSAAPRLAIVAAPEG